MLFVLIQGSVLVYTRGSLPVEHAIAQSAQHPHGSPNLLPTYIKASNTDPHDAFGFRVALDATTLAVSAPYESSAATGIQGDQSNNMALQSGAVYIFVRDGDTWVQQAYLKASNTDAGDGFGVSLALDGDTLVVGAYAEDSAATGINGNQADNSAANAGAAYVFVRSGSTWSQQAYLKASNTDEGDGFGYRVAIDATTVVISARGEDSGAMGVNNDQANNDKVDAGAAYVFVRSGSTWSQQAYLKASNTDADDGFGYSVSIENQLIAVGANGEDGSTTGVNGGQDDNTAPDAGAAYVFVRSGSTWSQQAYLKASNTDADDGFGQRVQLAGSTVVVSAVREDSAATGVNGNQHDNTAMDAGAAYVFVQNGNTWSQQAYLKASNTNAGDGFGYNLHALGDWILIGAPYEASAATIINGNQHDNNANRAGAAYLFARQQTLWSQSAYLKAMNTDSGDLFGNTMGMNESLIIVGASNEDSNTLGINGDHANNLALNSGAVYSFPFAMIPSIRAYLPLTTRGE